MTDLETINLAHHRLRNHENELRSNIYGPNPAAETLIIDQRDGALYRYTAPTFTPLGHGPDAWIGELPHTPWPPAPQPAEPDEDVVPGMRPDGYISRHRRRLAPLLRGVLIGGGVVAAVYTGLIVAAWAVIA